MRRIIATLTGAALAGLCGAAARAAPSVLEPRVLPPAAAPGPDVQAYVKIPAGRVALTHVRIIDGAGGPSQPDRTLVLGSGRITAILPAGAAPPAGATVLDLSGRTVLPGLVGMHDHMYYIARPDLDAAGHSEPPLVVPQMTFSSPRLYLANGVTTLRTTGSVEPYADINLKRLIDAGQLVGPHMDVTGPYLEGANSPFIQMHPLRDAEDARRTVSFWADQGATSFKAYMNITRAELKAAIDEAHRRGLKLTGHLCAVTYPEAAALGIDNLEHGFFVNTQLDPGKTPDVCPRTTGGPTLVAMTPNGPEARALIQDLVARHVTITSTLPVFEQSVPGHAPLSPRAMAVLTPEAREAYLYARNRTNSAPREVELLVEAGFTPEQAVKIATYNGAQYLGLQDRIGSIAPGKDADLVVVKGDPSRAITDIENVEIVFKDGVGYDSAALLRSVQGRYGQY